MGDRVKELMMITSVDVLDAALPLEGLEWHPSGSSQESGCNCIGLMIIIATKLNLKNLTNAFKPFVGMVSESEPGSLLNALRKNMDFIAPISAKPGDVLLVKMRGRNPSEPELTHVVLMLEHGEILESLCLDKKRLTGRVLRRLNPYKVHSAWRIPGIVEK